jgi:hypothetical protein
MHRLLALLVITAGILHAAPMIGVLQPSPDRTAQFAAAGVRHVVLSISWDRWEPAPDKIDPGYVRQLSEETAAYRRAGLQVVLDPGIQYPPEWLRQLPDARYQNQYGDLYVDRASGKNIANTVFNAAVRLGGGWYGELNYTDPTFAKRPNGYWAFDPIAQGTQSGLPAGMQPCPVPGWKPGTPSPELKNLQPAFTP